VRARTARPRRRPAKPPAEPLLVPGADTAQLVVMFVVLPGGLLPLPPPSSPPTPPASWCGVTPPPSWPGVDPPSLPVEPLSLPVPASLPPPLHAPVPVLHVCPLGQSFGPVHGPHVFVVVLQTGVVGVVQSLFVLHATHDPEFVPEVAHTWPFVQSPLPVQARHVLLPVSQIGFGAAQSVPVKQPTHVKLVVSQMGVVPVHAALLFPSHWTQLPVFVPVISQTGFDVPVQSLDTQARQVSFVASQTGVPPMHAAEFDAVH
jgi:hypothetical protein